MEHFIEFDNKQYERSQTVDPDNVAIFLFPGILGNGSELNNLAKAINDIRKGRTPIYIYNQPKDANGMPTEKPLKQEAADIAAEMRKLRGDTNLPYIMAGYSYGADLMHEVAEDLASHGFDPFKIAIDNPAPGCVKAYIENDSDDFKKDLIKIINYAAELSGIETLLNPDDVILEKLQNVELEDRVDLISNQLFDLQTNSIHEDSVIAFNSYLAIAKQNLRNLAYANTNSSTKSTKTHLIITSETSRKYGNGNSADINFNAGWDECSSVVVRLNKHITSKLWRQDHMNLLSNENAGLLAATINSLLKHEITEDLLRQRHAEKWFDPRTKEAILTTALLKTRQPYSPTYFSGFNLNTNTGTPFITAIDSKIPATCSLDQNIASKTHMKLR